MDIVIKVFTIVGSILGIFAFWQSFVKPHFIYNKEKWKKLLDTINFEDFEILEENCEHKIIKYHLNNKLATFAEMIKNNSEKLKFRTFIPFFNIHKFRLKKFIVKYKKFVNLVQEPYWTLRGYSNKSDVSVLDNDFYLNRKEFYKDLKNKDIREIDKIIESHLDEVFDIIKEMKKTFSKLGKGLNKDPYQIFFFWVK